MSAAQSTVRSRRSIRNFTKQEPTLDQIGHILECARWAPSCMNSQPWKFIVVSDKKKVDQLLHICFYGITAFNPPVIIAIVLESRESSDIHYKTKQRFVPYIDHMSAAMPALNIQHATEELGLYSCIKTPISKETNRLLKVPDSSDTVILVGVGYKNSHFSERKNTRKPLQKLVYNNEYGKLYYEELHKH